MNPYEVLGVSETATDEQVRSAYIKLVKKYHPDRYQDSDLKDLANDKLKQVNEAYDTITNMRKNGSASQNTYSGSGFGGYSGSSSRTSSGGYSGNYGSGYSGNFSAEFARVRQCINTSSLYEAQAILDGIPLHNAEWHYLYGIVCFRGGDYSSARNYLDRAVSMEPGNAEYRRARDSLNARSTRSYHTYDNGDTGATVNTACNCCSTLLCADSCCECMGGDLIPCCGVSAFSAAFGALQLLYTHEKNFCNNKTDPFRHEHRAQRCVSLCGIRHSDGKACAVLFDIAHAVDTPQGTRRVRIRPYELCGNGRDMFFSDSEQAVFCSVHPVFRLLRND